MKEIEQVAELSFISENMKYMFKSGVKLTLKKLKS